MHYLKVEGFVLFEGLGLKPIVQPLKIVFLRDCSKALREESVSKGIFATKISSQNIKITVKDKSDFLS